MAGEVIEVAHIQGDFEQAVQESGEFYINLDIAPDRIEEYRVKEEDGKFVVKHQDGGSGSFGKVRDGLYEAVLGGNRFQFRVPIQLIEEHALGNDEMCDLESGDATGEHIVIGDSRGSIVVYSSDWKRQLDLEQAHSSDVTVVKLFPSGEVILSGSNDMQLKIWSIADGSNPRTLRGHTGAITDAILIGKGRNILSASTDGSVRLWELGSGEMIHKFTRRENKLDSALCISLVSSEENTDTIYQPSPLEFGIGGKQVLIGHQSGTISLHHLASKKQVAQFPNAFMSPCTAVLTINDRLFLAGYENGTLALWDINQSDTYVQRLRIKNDYCVNRLYVHKEQIFIACGVDTVFSIVISGRELLTSTATMIVNSDSHITQFINIPNQEHDNLLLIGKWKYCSLYEY
ncbi:26S proteasome regulatory subunit RPN14 [Nakaseomyces bracarensis]|uniref:26S proteasome regulatory subunit RPN14 n=1 Tax=Nakaseomyces bracarensis TaxID=273131 RepID=A0ABR4NPG5_9SACH